MKRILLVLTTAMLCTFGLYAQTKITGTVVDKDNQPLMGVQVMPEAGGDAVTTDFDGKFEITVPEGTKLTFSMLGAKAKTEVAADKMVVVMGAKNSETSKNGKKFQGMVDLNTNFMSSHGGIGADIILGARLRPYYHIGGGLGIHSLLNANTKDNNVFATLYFNNIFYIPTSGKVFPMFDCAVGCDLGWLGIGQSYKTTILGLYAKAGAGIEVGMFNASVGYEYMGTHTGYVKLGINF